MDVKKLFCTLQDEIIQSIKNNDKELFRQYCISIYNIVERFYYTPTSNIIEIMKRDEFLKYSKFTKQLHETCLIDCSLFTTYFMYSDKFVWNIEINKYNKNTNMYLFSCILFQNMMEAKGNHFLDNSLKKCFKELKDKHNLYSFLSEIEPQKRLQDKIINYEHYFVNNILRIDQDDKVESPEILSLINKKLDEIIIEELSESYKEFMNELVQLSDIWYPIMYYKQYDSNIKDIKTAIGIFSDTFNIFDHIMHMDQEYIAKLFKSPEYISKDDKIILFLLFNKTKNKMKFNIKNKDLHISFTAYSRNPKRITNTELLRFKQKILSIESNNIKVNDFFKEFLKNY